MLGMQSRAEDLNSLMLGVETTEVGKQFQVLTVLGKNEYKHKYHQNHFKVDFKFSLQHKFLC